jgi:hypothetical protein
MRDPRPVLFVAQAYPPENVIGALRPFRFAKYLPQFGYLPHIVTASAQAHGADKNIHYVPDRTRLWERALNRVMRFNESLSWATAAASASAEIIRVHDIRLIFSTAPPMAVHLAARRLHRQLGVRWVADFRDPMGGNDARTTAAIHALDSHFEPRFFRDAAAIVANTAAAADLLQSRWPAHREKVHTIYNGFDREDESLRALPIRNRTERVLTHAGSLYRVSMHRALLEAMSQAVRNRRVSDVRLKFIGLNEDDAALTMPAVLHLRSEGVLNWSTDLVQLAEARRMMAESDGLVAIDRYRAGGIIQLPAKTFEYIQVGRPILAVTAPGSPMEYALRTSGVRHVCLYPESDSPEALVAKIVEYLKLPNEPVPMTQGYEAEFSAREQTRRLAQIFDAVQAV